MIDRQPLLQNEYGRSRREPAASDNKLEQKSRNSTKMVGKDSAAQEQGTSKTEKVQCTQSAESTKRQASTPQENHGKGSYKGIQLKGLSPPKEDFVFRKKGGTDNIEAPKDADISARTWPTITSGSLEGGRFDKTQWERTRFATEATRKSAEIIEKPLNTEEQPAKETSAEAPLIGESRQSMAVRGGYLNTRPTGVILLLTIELILCVTCVVVWATVAENPLTPQLIVVANLVAVFFFILVCLSVEFFRYQVRREDNKSETRFFVPYNWRFSLFEAHLARAALLGANITIIAVEKTFDTGSIIVLVASPIHLLLVVVHVFSALKPKR